MSPDVEIAIISAGFAGLSVRPSDRNIYLATAASAKPE